MDFGTTSCVLFCTLFCLFFGDTVVLTFTSSLCLSKDSQVRDSPDLDPVKDFTVRLKSLNGGKRSLLNTPKKKSVRKNPVQLNPKIVNVHFLNT